LCDFLLVINSNLDFISHRLATIRLLHTDRQMDTLLLVSRLMDNVMLSVVAAGFLTTGDGYAPGNYALLGPDSQRILR